MNILQNAPAGDQTITQFVFYNRRNRAFICFAAAAIIIQFTVFKYLYPFANYIHDDSFVYIDAAFANSTINAYPIGYSKFLRLVSVFAKPDLVLTGLQYFMIQGSTLFLLFTIFYFYKAGQVAQAVLFFFMTFNPLALHLGNMISSDGLFVALSMTWFALLLWIIFKPSNKIICWHAIVLLAAFTVRYNALIYPLITTLAFGLSTLPLRRKIAGLGLGILLIGWFVGLSMFQYKKITGIWQYSPFSGWQLANNAMYSYREVDSTDRKPVPSEFRSLDNMVRNFHDMHPDWQVTSAGTAYMWLPQFPFMQYRDSLLKKEGSARQFKNWANLGPLYRSYGMYIIKKYPAQFLRYFVWPNSLKYFSPPVEYLGKYNWGKPTVKKQATVWFGYTNNLVRTRMESGKVWILRFYPFLIGLANMIMFLGLLSYLLLKGWQYNPIFNKCILLAGFVWITNATFTIFASSAALRFQTFPSLLSVIFSLLLIDWMAKYIQHIKRQIQQQTPDIEYPQKAIV